MTYDPIKLATLADELSQAERRLDLLRTVSAEDMVVTVRTDRVSPVVADTFDSVAARHVPMGVILSGMVMRAKRECEALRQRIADHVNGH